MRVKDIMTASVESIESTDTIAHAARRMAGDDVGALPILTEGRLVGIVTDRDIALRCVAGRFDPGETPISELMSTPVHSVDEHTPVEDAVARMADLGIRRLVVTGEENSVVGILSLDDILELIIEETRAVGRLLEQQKPRIPA